jgi:trk system potassium uptake protein TrkH
MRWRYTLHVVGVLLVSIGLSMLLALAFSTPARDTLPLLASAAASLAAGFGLALGFRRKTPRPMTHREGMAIVALGWVAAGIFGALPFWLGGVFPGFIDCLFESFSGFTTTGASVLTDIESVPRGILFWRSLTHWLGGMGIIVLSLAILPYLGVGGMQLYKAEVPGPVPDKLKPRIKDTALILWKVYLLFTAAQTALLLLGGMSFFDALCHTFGTVATGGFSTRNASIAAYGSLYIEIVVILFMLLAGINFSLHYLLLTGRPLAMWRDPECRFFVSVFLAFTALSTASIWVGGGGTIGSSLRTASFHVASILTTTGYASGNYELWPALPQGLLLLSMFLGGCAGSTGGGMKCMRILLLFKHAYREIHRLIHPHAVTLVKLGGKPVPPDVIGSISSFFFLFLGIFILSALLLATMGVDLTTSFSAVIACMGNIGPGIGSVGPTENYAHIPEAGKVLLVLCMLLGRLEIYTILVLLVPEFWRK